MKRPGLLVLVLAGTAHGASAAETFKRLNGQEIAARFADAELTDGIHWGLIFRKGGRLIATEAGGRITAVPKEARPGTWRVRHDEICIQTDGAPRCSEVWAVGRKIQLRHEGEPPQDGILQKPEAVQDRKGRR